MTKVDHLGGRKDAFLLVQGEARRLQTGEDDAEIFHMLFHGRTHYQNICLLYTSDAADE